MRIFRIENDNGDGPYQSGDDIQNMYGELMDDTHAGDPSRPTASSDGLGYAVGFGIVFGFPTLKHMERWFEGWFPHMHDAGYSLTVWEVAPKYVRYGDLSVQVVFHRDKAKMVDKISLSTIE